MPAKKRVAVITYNGVDGACAAAMVLLLHPDAEVLVSSAASIGYTLGLLEQEKRDFSEIHVCGVGAWCDWEEVVRPAEALRERGTWIFWYCGRGYLDDEREDFEEIATPVFMKCRTNARAVCEHLELDGWEDATRLLAIAKEDPQVKEGGREPGPEIAFWRDLIEASVAMYFKYRDRDSYAATIRKLAKLEHDRRDEDMVAVFRETGFRYVLHGRSKQIGRLKEIVRMCAGADEPVIISGETGTGKEHVAHLIHEGSRRAREPFVPVNCAILAGNTALANSTLFGHVQGAFTGAETDRAGAFVAADPGILFLDEFAELPLEVQAKMLRVLEDGCVTREGADRPERQVNVRVIAATNRDLPALIRSGRVRADFYHRLDTLRVRVPPLRERPRDIDEIVGMTLADLAGTGRKRKMTAQDYKTLRDYEWPGNVRQLMKLVRRAVYLEMSISEAVKEERGLGSLTPVEAGAEREGDFLPSSADRVRPWVEVRREYVARALELHGGNYKATARVLGIAVNTLRSYLSGQ